MSLDYDKKSYFVKLKCSNIDCHANLKKKFGPDNYYHITSHYSIINAANLSILSLERDIITVDSLEPVLKQEQSIITNLESTGHEISIIKQYHISIKRNANKDNKFKAELTKLNSLSQNITIDWDNVSEVLVISIQDNSKNIKKLISSISMIDEVIWIEERCHIKLFNKWAKGVLLSGGLSASSSISNYLTSANLTGFGQIIGISDSGIDMTSSFFADLNRPVPYNVIEPSNRKVVYYNTYVDGQDDLSGHGTHVAASAAGSIDTELSNQNSQCNIASAYKGIASGAKIAFFDIGNSNSVLAIPANLASGLFYPLYIAGARVFSNSWGSYGSNANKYNTDSRSVDIFMWQYPESLIVFAAGNEGIYGENTVVSPCTSKNSLCVGAGLNDPSGWLSNVRSSKSSKQIQQSSYSIREFFDPSKLFCKNFSFHNTASNNNSFDSSTVIIPSNGYGSPFSVDALAFFSSQGPTYDNRIKPDIVGPGWTITSAGVLGANAQDSQQGHCTLKAMRGTSMATPTVAGSAAIVREYFMRGFYPTGVANDADSFIPSGALLKAMIVHSGQRIKYIVDSSGSTKPINDYPSMQSGYGRMQLDKVLNFGVSSSSPLTLFVIGSAYNPSFNSTSTEKTRFGRNWTRQLHLSKRTIRLKHVLLQANILLNSINSKINTKNNEEIKRQPIYLSLTSTGQKYSMIVTTGNSASSLANGLRVTMAYTDIVGSSGATDAILLNDLDLTVELTSQVQSTKLNAQNTDDDVRKVAHNTVEMIHLSNLLSNTNYTVTVTAKTLVAEQSFAIVITGDLTNFYNSNQQNNNNSSEYINNIGNMLKSIYSSMHPAYKLTVVILFAIAFLKLLSCVIRSIFKCCSSKPATHNYNA